MSARLIPEVSLDEQQKILCLKGTVSFATAGRLAETGRRLIERCSKCPLLSIDARGVESSSSATLTVVLEWWRAMNECHITLDSIRLPEQMAPLVALSGLGRILPRG